MMSLNFENEVNASGERGIVWKTFNSCSFRTWMSCGDEYKINALLLNRKKKNNKI